MQWTLFLHARADWMHVCFNFGNMTELHTLHQICTHGSVPSYSSSQQYTEAYLHQTVGLDRDIHTYKPIIHLEERSQFSQNHPNGLWSLSRQEQPALASSFFPLLVKSEWLDAGGMANTETSFAPAGCLLPLGGKSGSTFLSNEDGLCSQMCECVCSARI